MVRIRPGVPYGELITSIVQEQYEYTQRPFPGDPIPIQFRSLRISSSGTKAARVSPPAISKHTVDNIAGGNSNETKLVISFGNCYVGHLNMRRSEMYIPVVVVSRVRNSLSPPRDCSCALLATKGCLVYIVH